MPLTLFHPGDLGLYGLLWIVLIWGGIFAGLIYVLARVIKYLKKR